ncbi:MAG TPA: hypothetical protein V6D21_01555 [Candidatus Obscuribacterales bacterium]
MINLDTIQQDIASLPPDAQQVILELVYVLKKSYLPNQQESPESKTQDWSDFIGCIEAEPDLSRNYKTYLSSELEEKYDHR